MSFDVLDEIVQKNFHRESEWGAPITSRRPKVSVCVATYQHASYIGQCLESVISQITSFEYEVIVGDDGSHDGTTEICKQYALRYPDKIRLYIRDRATSHIELDGRKIRLNGIFCRMAARGEYIAICEGDDFWCDSGKLQKQVDAMERNPNIDLCFHPTYNLYANGKLEKSCCYSSETCVIPLEKVISGGGSFMPTPSLLLRRSAWLAMPKWFPAAPVGDYYMQMLGSHNGALFLPCAMSTYRRFSTGSWTSHNRTMSAQQIERFANDQCKFLELTEKAIGRFELQDAFQRAKSFECQIASSIAIATKHYGLAKMYIVNSWRLYPWNTRVQTGIFVLRYCLSVVRLAKRLFNKI